MHAILTAQPIDYPHLVKIEGQILDSEKKTTKHGFAYEPLPWTTISRGLILSERTRERSQQLLSDGFPAPLGVHLLTLCQKKGFR